ncbi:hypothetical protein C8J57DRAFT_1604410 [Mycena rebaudengoi]|nr:hypothetical protein C8J57DRAFT_1604410 [Mycena rebaudengoi]
MHPFLLRRCWIESATRNGSGNGGTALFGFVLMPAALREIDPKAEYNSLKRKIYHMTRVAHPGILIESMDFEDLTAWLAIRNSRSNHPCQKCLVHHDDLHKLFKCSDRRTSQSMQRVLTRAVNLNVTEREELLKSYGLHNFKHFLWIFNYSDPYAAASYDLLHYFDGASRFNDMNRFPRWRGLKHIPSPTTIDYSEGQTFVDIVKLLPRDSCLVRIVRAMQKVRILLGLSVTTRIRQDHLNDLVHEYEDACNEVHEALGKDFNFLKQHSLTHAFEDFMSKGTSRNMNTRVGKGFQQEVEIGLQDEREEAMARVKMAVDGWRRCQQDTDLEESERTVIPAASEISSGHWTLGSPAPRVSAHRLEAERKSYPAFRDLNMRLRDYIARHHSTHQVRLEQKIQCKVIYVEYQSKVDWRSARDILRCNPHFHGAPRFDSVIYEDDDSSLAMGQFHCLFRCHIPGDSALDLAMVRPFRRTAWQPNTRTDCPIREILPLKSCHFIALEHIVRGALLSPISWGKDGMHHIIDCIDEDMYLRVHNVD